MAAKLKSFTQPGDATNKSLNFIKTDIRNDKEIPGGPKNSSDELSKSVVSSSVDEDPNKQDGGKDEQDKSD